METGDNFTYLSVELNCHFAQKQFLFPEGLINSKAMRVFGPLSQISDESFGGIGCFASYNDAVVKDRKFFDDKHSIATLHLAHLEFEAIFLDLFQWRGPARYVSEPVPLDNKRTHVIGSDAAGRRYFINGLQDHYSSDMIGYDFQRPTPDKTL